MKQLTFTEKATESLRRAVAQVIAARRKSGEPIAIWKNGKAVWEYPKSPNGVRERPARYPRG